MEPISNKPTAHSVLAWYYIVSGIIGLLMSLSAIFQNALSVFGAVAWLLLLGQLGASIYGGISLLKNRQRGLKTLYWVSLSCIPMIGFSLFAYFSVIGVGVLPSVGFGDGYLGTNFNLKLGYDSVLEFFPDSDHITLGVNLVAVALTAYLRSILNGQRETVESSSDTSTT